LQHFTLHHLIKLCLSQQLATMTALHNEAKESLTRLRMESDEGNKRAVNSDLKSAELSVRCEGLTKTNNDLERELDRTRRDLENMRETRV